jgi:tetratricopeptide (TPR) repeat protein
MRAAALIAACAVASGCAALPEKPPSPASVIAPLSQMLDTADKSRADGHVQKARDAYRLAAASYPSEHLPWVRLAQSHFESADYGNAIIAAEEALQRNPHDQTALGVMTVSGLRVSSRAVSRLNEKHALGDSRSQAESIVQTLRSALGESSLLASQSEVAPEKPSKMPTQATTHTVERASSKPPKQGQTTPTANTPPTASRSASGPASASTSTSVKRSLPVSNPLEVLR